MSNQGFMVPKPCEDCGSDPVFHRLTRWSIVLEDALVIIASPGSWVLQVIPNASDKALDVVLPPLLSLMKMLRLGHETFEVDEKDFKYVTHVLWEEAKRRGINMVQFRPFGKAKHLFVASFGKEKVVFDRIPVARGSGRGTTWIDDKAILKKHLLKQGLPVARGEAVRSESGAIALFDSLHKPVIVKPHQGSGTRHTTLHVNTKTELLQAFGIAKRISPFVVIEEELTGPVYRPTVVNGKLVATIERHQPFVVGNGKSTINELIAELNKHPKRSGPIFSQIKQTDALKKELERQNCTLESVLETGVRVDLHQKINWSVGGHTRDVTHLVHPDNKKLFEDIAQITKAPIVGIDFIIKDISRSWRETEMCGVIETNSMPFFDTHHFPFEGEPQDVAGAIWDMVFPASK